VVGYDIYESGVKIVSVAASINPQVTITGLAPATLYTFSAKARNAGGAASDFSNTLQLTTLAAIGSVTAPGKLTSTQIGDTSATLSWTPSTDCCDHATVYYDVYQGGAKILTFDATVTTVTVVGLVPNSTYTFAVRAGDTQGNMSPSSNSLMLTTNAGPDVLP
jgi:chitodextrinase